MSNKISKETENAIIRLYESGKNYRFISDILNISKNTITRCLKRNFIGKYGNTLVRVNKDIKESVIKMFVSGIHMKEIQKKNKLSYHMTKKILLEEGIKLPGSGYKHVDDETIKSILRLFDSNLSISVIAKKMSKSTKTVSSILIKNGRKLSARPAREKHGNWKGGRIFVNGYTMIRPTKDDKNFIMCNCDGYVMEHRYVMANHLGRPLTKQETVHHIDGNTLNNEINNLQLRQTRHGKGQKFTCCDCGSNNIQAKEL